MSGSTIPAALNALTALFTSVNVAGVTVVDGPFYDPTVDFLAVGWDRSGQESVVFSNAASGAEPRRGKETYEITNMLSFWYGADNDLPACRDRLFAAYQQYADALAGALRLGGTVLTAWPTSGALTPSRDEGGTYVDLRFTITCQALK